jgi:hypothetical protein
MNWVMMLENDQINVTMPIKHSPSIYEFIAILMMMMMMMSIDELISTYSRTFSF